MRKETKKSYSSRNMIVPGQMRKKNQKIFMCYIIISIFCCPLSFIFRKIFVAFTVMLMLFIFFLFRKIWYFSWSYFLFSSSSERFWYLSRVSFWSLSFFYIWVFILSEPLEIAWNHLKLFNHTNQQSSIIWLFIYVTMKAVAFES